MNTKGAIDLEKALSENFPLFKVSKLIQLLNGASHVIPCTLAPKTPVYVTIIPGRCMLATMLFEHEDVTKKVVEILSKEVDQCPYVEYKQPYSAGTMVTYEWATANINEVAEILIASPGDRYDIVKLKGEPWVGEISE
jgi:hypothetical protein